MVSKKVVKKTGQSIIRQRIRIVKHVEIEVSVELKLALRYRKKMVLWVILRLPSIKKRMHEL